MATDHQRQRIHPESDVEAPPSTTPLVPNGSLPSDKEIPTHHQHESPQSRFLATQATIPARKTNCLCKCLCWTIGLIVALILVIAATVAILYFVFEPKLPNYSVDDLRISDLRLNLDATLYAKFEVKITAHNPNEKIGIYYERGGKLSVWYAETRLCEGSLPHFYQGHQNKTVLVVALAGQSQYGTTLMQAMLEQQRSGRVPLELKVRAPVSVRLGSLKMRKVRVLGACLLVVDSLSTNNLISIEASNCKFRLKL